MDKPIEREVGLVEMAPIVRPAELGATELAAALAKFPCHFNWGLDEKAFNQKLDDNLKTCLTHLNSTPTDITVHNFLGFIYCFKRDYAKARTHFNQCQALRPADQVSLANLAYCYLRQGNTAAAQEKLHALQQMPTNDETRGLQHWSHAYAHVRLYQYTNADEQYALAQKFLKDPRLHVLRGILCNREKRFRDALRLLAPANDGVYSDYLLFTHLGRAHGGLRQYQLAIECFEKASNTVPNDMGVIMQFYGKMLSSMRQDEQALKLLSDAINRQPTTYAYHQRGLLQLKSNNKKVKNSKKAEADFRQAIVLRASNFYAVTNLIQMLLEKKERAALEEALDLCLHYEQSFVPKATLYYLWGRCLAKLNNMASAEEKFLLALSRGDEDDDTLSYYRHAYNWLKQYYQNQHKESNDRLWHIKLLKLEVRANNYDSAISLFEVVRHECNDLPELHFCYGQALMAVGRNMDAIAAFNKAKQLYVIEKDKKNCDQLLATALLQEVEQERDMHRVVFYCLDIIQYTNLPAQLTQAYTTLSAALSQIIKKLPKEDVHYRFAAFAMDGLGSAEESQEIVTAAKRNIYESLGLFREASSESTRLHDQAAIQRCTEATGQEVSCTFSSETQKVLADLRFNYLKLKQAELKNDLVAQKELVNKLIEDGRKLLDYLFINFLKTKIHPPAAKLMGAFFPCVPESKDSRSLDERLQQYLSSRGEQRWIGLANPKVNFPKLYEFLLAIQPLKNPTYQWLRSLYDCRNKIAHETQLGLIIDINGANLNAIAFVEQFFFGVQNIIRDFYRAYSTDMKIPAPAMPELDPVDESAFFNNVLRMMTSIMQARTAAKQLAAKENSSAKPVECTPPAAGSIAAPVVLFPPAPATAALAKVAAPIPPLPAAASPKK